MKLLIITGMSGAGKSQTLNIMEDLGYFCVDNLPPKLLTTFVDLMQSRSDAAVTKLAVVIDIRGGEFFDDIYEVLLEVGKVTQYDVLFLDASDEVLLLRYKETRRLHPLARYGSLREGITRERQLLEHLKQTANHIIDTSRLHISELRQKLLERYLEGRINDSFPVRIISFGYKWGIPEDADLVFDVRCIKNPFYLDRLRMHTGRDKEVIDYIMSFPQSQELISHISNMLGFLLPLYVAEGKNELVVAIGCTGGMHRSVAIADKIAAGVDKLGYPVMVTHRDMQREQDLRR